jgi:uncharacterized protein (DUF342 family)
MSKPEFILADDRVSVLVRLVADDDSSVPDAERVREAFLGSRFRRCLLQPAALDSVIGEWRSRAGAGQDPSLFDPAVIATCGHAVLEIRVAEDAMAAEAAIQAAAGGKHLEATDVVLALREEGICHGLVMRDIADLVRTARDAEPGSRVTRRVAQGRAPVHGENARLEPLAPTLEDRELRPKEREDGSVDLRDLGGFAVVQPGTPLLRRQPPEAGRDGLNVRGQAVPFRPGQDLALQPGEGAEIDATDRDLVRAARQGIPRRLDDGIGVDPVLHLERVDLSTGNIDFEGTVLVTGDVTEDMKVRASGDVCVGGLVESALIEAGGSIIVDKGIIGHRHAGKDPSTRGFSVRLVAHRDIRATYAQNAELESGRSVRITKYLYHSRVSARDMVWIGRDKKPDGRLVGGMVSAGSTVHAGVIGMPSGTPTRIDFSRVVAELRSQSEDLRRELEQLEGEREKLHTLYERFQRVDTDPTKIQRIQATLGVYDRRAAAHKDALSAGLRREKEVLSGIALRALETLFPGVGVRVLEKSLTTSVEHNAVRVVFREDGLRIEPLGR